MTKGNLIGGFIAILAGTYLSRGLKFRKPVRNIRGIRNIRNIQGVRKHRWHNVNARFGASVEKHFNKMRHLDGRENS